MTAQQFIRSLKPYRGKLPVQTIRTLRGQALAGDVEGARRGLARLLHSTAAKRYITCRPSENSEKNRLKEREAV